MRERISVFSLRSTSTAREKQMPPFKTVVSCGVNRWLQSSVIRPDHPAHNMTCHLGTSRLPLHIKKIYRPWVIHRSHPELGSAHRGGLPNDIFIKVDECL